MFYTISNDNAITSHDTFAQATAALGATPEANALPATNNGIILFQSSKEFTTFTMNCPVDRLVQIWNGLAVSPFGKQEKLKPVTKFENRQVATVRIWKAIQNLNGTAGGPAPAGALETGAKGDAPKPKKAPKAKPADAPAPKATTPAKKESPKGSKPAKAAKPATKKETTAPREGTAKAKVIAMMQRKGGATLESIMKETGWQKHTVRGFISILGSKHGLKIASSKRESDGARVYSVE